MLVCVVTARGQAFRFRGVEPMTNRETVVSLEGLAGDKYRLQTSTNLRDWESLTTLQSAGQNKHTNFEATARSLRFYRAYEAEAGALTGDHLATTNGDVTIHPFIHASILLEWNNLAIYVDPTNRNLVTQGFPRADLILITHGHNDHFNSTAVDNLRTNSTVILTTSTVYNSLSAGAKSATTILANGGTVAVQGVHVEAVPAYNLGSANHPKDRDNGYIVTLGGKRIWISGDTDETPELLQFRNIDVAFVCMRPTFTMSMADAADAVRTIQPRVVYPYHYLGQDINVFKALVGQDLGIEVRLRNWY